MVFQGAYIHAISLLMAGIVIFNFPDYFLYLTMQRYISPHYRGALSHDWASVQKNDSKDTAPIKSASYKLKSVTPSH